MAEVSAQQGSGQIGEQKFTLLLKTGERTVVLSRRATHGTLISRRPKDEEQNREGGGKKENRRLTSSLKEKKGKCKHRHLEIPKVSGDAR